MYIHCMCNGILAGAKVHMYFVRCTTYYPDRCTYIKRCQYNVIGKLPFFLVQVGKVRYGAMHAFIEPPSCKLTVSRLGAYLLRNGASTECRIR